MKVFSLDSVFAEPPISSRKSYFVQEVQVSKADAWFLIALKDGRIREKKVEADYSCSNSNDILSNYTTELSKDKMCDRESLLILAH